MEDQKVRRFLAVSFGSGYGSGSGDGYGSGSGSGSGDGSGYGDGYGSGSGSGDGSGVLSFNKERVWMIDGVQTIVRSIRGNVAKGAILQSDLTLTPCFIARVGDSFAHGETIEKATRDATGKHNERRPVEERIAEFVGWAKDTPEAPASEYSRWHKVLTGSCEMGRLSFMNDKGISMEQIFTPMEFLALVKDAYAQDIIQLAISTLEGVGNNDE